MNNIDLDSFLNNTNTNNNIGFNSISIFSDQSTPSLKIYNFLSKKLGDDWWENEFESIETYLKSNFGIILSDQNREKVQALRRLCNSNLGFIDWYEFNILALSLSGGIVDFESLIQPTPGMIVAAVKIMNTVRPDQNGMFGEEVKKYITLSLLDAGLYTPPPSLVDLVSRYMSTLVTKERVNEWKDSVKDSFKIIENKADVDNSDTSLAVQANRIAKAELSAHIHVG